MDGRSNRRNKAALSNFSGVVWMEPKAEDLKYLSNTALYLNPSKIANILTRLPHYTDLFSS